MFSRFIITKIQHENYSITDAIVAFLLYYDQKITHAVLYNVT